MCHKAHPLVDCFDLYSILGKTISVILKLYEPEIYAVTHGIYMAKHNNNLDETYTLSSVSLTKGRNPENEK